MPEITLQNTFILFIALYLSHKVWIRLRLSRAKHPSLRGHSKMSRRVARIIPYFEYNEANFFSSDAAPQVISQQRRQALNRLKQHFNQHMPKGIEFNHSVQDSISDVEFTNQYRVPFPFRKYLSTQLTLPNAVQESKGVKVKDLDGNWSYDLTGSYGVNVFGYDFYKQCMQDGMEMVKDMGPVLGAYHPIIKRNVERLKKISGLDEVSFHMSGTEAVMQAVRLARYHTGKTHLVRLCGAYHGWWDGVQPGIGNQRASNDVYTLQDMSDATLKVLRTRNDIACVLINPLQGLHPNADASSDASLVNSERSAQFDRKAYSRWLKQVSEVCIERSIVLIFDEVFTGFRLAYRGAQEYFGVQADIVTYGKTLGGGLPVGVVCGSHALMKRYKPEQPVNVSFARGTFNSHPYVMACMHQFLTRIQQPEYQNNYQHADELWNARVSLLNKRLHDEDLPVRIANLMSIWTILYSQPSRYNWMFQFYLKAQGLSLSWVGSGRIIMSHNFSDENFLSVVDLFITAARQMKNDGWWWHNPNLSNKAIKRIMLKEMIATRFPVLSRWLKPKTGHTGLSTAEEVSEL
jgi:glutamate-1-semialdehyde 2,1-aminomutase